MVRHSITTAFVALLGVCVAGTAEAQITSYTMTFYQAGSQVVLGTTPIPVSVLACGQPKVTVTTTVNPAKLAFDDPANTSLDCIYRAPTTDILRTLPNGTYELTVRSVDATGAGPESPRLPFSRQVVAPPPQPPPAPSNLRLLP